MAVIDQTARTQPDFVAKPFADPVPGVEIVLPTTNNEATDLLDPRTLKLIGSLHRRFWSRRKNLLMGRAQLGQSVAPRDASPESLVYTIDLAGPSAKTWDGRLGLHADLRNISEADDKSETPPRIAIRGWGETEPGVLVDGRSVPACVFDIALALRSGADSFRRDEQPFTISIPVADCEEEQRLWNDLSNLAHDRTGIDRGTVEIGVDTY